MAGDRVVFNTLERALSGDVNDLQAMQSRVMAELLSVLGAQRYLMASGGALDTIPQSFTMGLDCRGAGAFIAVGPGLLSQLSFTWPAAPAGFEAAQRLGLLRTTVNVPVPATPNTAMLLEARVVDVVTVATNRDIFDVPTQTFIPTLVDKQVERQIEFQITDAGGPLPAFSGDPWVPVLGFVTDGAGLVPTLPTTFAWDFRNSLKDILGDTDARFTGDNEYPETQVTAWAAHTEDRAGNLRIGGSYEARNFWGRAWMRTDEGFFPAEDTTTPAAANAQEHIYLAPLTANGVTVWPVAMGSATLGATRGILMRSQIGPTPAGAENAAAMTWDPAAAYRNFDPVPARRAAYVTSVYVSPTGIVGGYVPMTQDSAGRLMLRADRAVGTTPTVSAVNRAPGAIAALELHPLGLGTKVPANARTARVRLFVQTAAAGATSARISFRRNGETQDYGVPMLVVDEAGVAAKTHTIELELPIHESSLSGVGVAKNWDLAIDPAVGLIDLFAVVVDVLGWSY